MPSPTYQVFRTAILGRKQITCIYRGKRRELCPHVLGTKGGQEKALAYQFAGESNSGLPPGGEWRCLRLVEVRDARARDGAWHTGSRHSTTQSCVDIVDVDVNR
jgi:hypothetical protein